MPLPLENVLYAGVTVGSALFPMYLSEKTKHGIARRCTSSYTNARFLGSLAAVEFFALPCLAWTSSSGSSKEGPATRHFQLLGVPKSQLTHLSMPCGLAAAYPLIRCRLAGRYMTAFCDSVVLLRRVTNRLWLLRPYLRAHFILTQR